MDEIIPAALLIAALVLAIYVVRRLAGAGTLAQPSAPPGASPGTLRLGQYAVQPGAQWLVLTAGDF